MNVKARNKMKILFADDGSEHARAAIKLLLDLPLPSETPVHLLRVFPAGQTHAVGQMEKDLNVTREELLSHQMRVKSELLLGDPAQKIVETSEQTRPTLTVLGAKGLRATLGILLGGVAQQVVEYAGSPVLVVRSPYHGLRRVLLVTDGSPSSRNAVRYLGRFPLPTGIDLRVMHVLPPLISPVIMEPYFGGRDTYLPTPAPEEEHRILAAQEREGKVLLDRTCESLSKSGLNASPVLVRGDAATEIIAYAKEEQVDLIAAGSRGLNQFQGWLMGSVSRKLVHYSDCSVLVVKRKEG